MSSPDFFPDIDPKNRPDKLEGSEDYDEDDKSSCPSCRFVIQEHSPKQILNCAVNHIRLVLGVEKT